MTYKEYLETPRWKEIAKFFKKEYPICQLCEKKKSQDVHHLTYERLGKELESDLLVVCRDCHFKKLHKGKKASENVKVDDLIQRIQREVQIYLPNFMIKHLVTKNPRLKKFLFDPNIKQGDQIVIRNMVSKDDEWLFYLIKIKEDDNYNFIAYTEAGLDEANLEKSNQTSTSSVEDEN